MNEQIKTIFLMSLMLGVMALVARLAGGCRYGKKLAVMVVLIAFGLNIFTYWFSDKIILKMWS